MGLTRVTAQLLLTESRRRPFAGSLAVLGRQHVYFSWNELQEMARRQGCRLQEVNEPKLHWDTKQAANGYLSDASCWQALGFDKVVSIDHSDFEGADVLLDLNTPDTPSELIGRFDTVFNLGTLEHVFHLPHALSHLHRFLRPEGRLVHLFPVANYVDHGFYSLSPTLLNDYYRANGYNIRQLSIVRFHAANERAPADVYDYFRPTPYGCNVGSLDDRPYCGFAIVERTRDAQADAIPQQGYYVAGWSTGKAAKDGTASETSGPVGRADRLLTTLHRFPRLKRFTASAIECYRSLRRRWARWRSPAPWEFVTRYR